MLYTNAALVSAACCVVSAAWWVSSSKCEKGNKIWMGKSKKTKKQKKKKHLNNLLNNRSRASHAWILIQCQLHASNCCIFIYMHNSTPLRSRVETTRPVQSRGSLERITKSLVSIFVHIYAQVIHATAAIAHFFPPSLNTLMFYWVLCLFLSALTPPTSWPSQ